MCALAARTRPAVFCEVPLGVLLRVLLGESLVFLKPLQPRFSLFNGEIVHLSVFLWLAAVIDMSQHVLQGYTRAREYRLSA